MHLVLASGSPRRLSLLRELGLDPIVRPPDVDETALPGEPPEAHVRRLAIAKRDAAVAAYEAERGGLPADFVVIAADTIVALDDQILGKPVDRSDAASTLRRLSGREHLVITGVAVTAAAGSDDATVTTVVRFGKLTPADIDWYVATGEPDDKAGSYAIQGRGGSFVESIIGSHDNVIGLPRHRLSQMLVALGHSLR